MWETRKKLKSYLVIIVLSKKRRRKEQKRLFQKANMSSAIDYSDPMNCRLHKARVSGQGLAYMPNTCGNYSTYSPPCSGCTFGAKERKMFADLWRLRTAWSEWKQSPVPANVQTFRDAIAVCLSSGDRDSESEANYRQKELEGTGQDV